MDATAPQQSAHFGPWLTIWLHPRQTPAAVGSVAELAGFFRGLLEDSGDKAEGQPTGIKEAVLLDRWLAANETILTGDGQLHFPGFDPDDPQYDAEFSDHPAARVRRCWITGPVRWL